jgi:DNA-directed RNA polymerase beta subunit/intein/homing endonuclease
MAARIRLRKSVPKEKESIGERKEPTFEDYDSLLSTNSFSGDPNITIESKLLLKMMEERGPRKAIIANFDDFIDVRIAKQLEARPFPVDGGDVKLSNVRIENYTDRSGQDEVRLTPRETRNTEVTYKAKIITDATFIPTVIDGDRSVDISSKDYDLTQRDREASRMNTTKKDIFIGEIPIMLRTDACILSEMSEGQRLNVGECTNDYGGYFIINGGERSIITQESLRTGLFMLWANDETGKVESRITNATDYGTTIVSMVLGTRWDTLKVGIQFIPQKHIPLYVAFAFLGYNEANATDLICHFIEEKYRLAVIMYLQSSMIKGRSIGSNIVAYIIDKKGKQKRNTKSYVDSASEITRIVRSHLFANIKSLNTKAKSLAYMASQIIMNIMGERGVDNRDSWGIKKLTPPGKMMEIKLNTLWSKMISGSKDKISKQGFRSKGVETFANSINSSEIGTEFSKSFMSGWTVKNGQVTESVTDSWKRDTPAAGISQITRLNAPSSRKGKKSSIREVKQTQLGYICIAETPEGEGALTGDTEIELCDGRFMKIKDLVKGQRIASIGFPGSEIQSKTTTAITKQWMFKTTGKKRRIYEVTLMTGDKIRATDDHPFFTQKGWVETEKLSVSKHSIGMVPQVEKVSDVSINSIVLTKKDFEAQIMRNGFDQKFAQFFSDSIGGRACPRETFFPVKSSDPEVAIMARVIGLVMYRGEIIYTNGNLQMKIGFKDYPDVQAFKKDVSQLGFIEDGFDKEEKYEHVMSYVGIFPALLAAFGAPIGSKLEMLPEWITMGSNLVLQNFLSGFVGGRKDCNFFTPLDFHSKYVLNDVNMMFDTMGVQMDHNKSESTLTLMNDSKNILKFATRINCRYNESSRTVTWLVGKYMQYCQRYPNHMSMEDFTKNCLGVKNKENVVHLPVESVKRVEDDYVYDIMVDSNDHTFIANGFVTHNCGLVENMALTCSISIDRETKDFFTVMRGDHEKYGNSIPQYYNQEPTPFDWSEVVYILDSEDPNYSDVENVEDYSELIIKDDDGPMEDESDEDYKIRIFLIKEEKINEKFPHPLLMNGIIVAWCDGPKLEKALMKCRQFKIVPFDSCIFFNEVRQSMEIDTSGGRCIRPLLVVHENELVIDKMNGWKLTNVNGGIDTLLETGAMTYIDSREQEKIMLATTADAVRNYSKTVEALKADVEKYKKMGDSRASELARLEETLDEMLTYPFTHSEISPVSMYGNLAGMIPYANKSQGPRITYQASMGKQALNQYHTLHGPERFDVSYKVMKDPALPIFQAEPCIPNGLNVMPSGDNIIKAIYAHPDNPEDGIVVNEETIKSGKFKIARFVTLKLIFKRKSNNDKVDEVPQLPPAQSFDNNRFHAITEDGTPSLGSFLKKGDCVIGRMRIFREGENIGKNQNASLYIGIGEEGIVDRISINKSSKGTVVKVKIRQDRIQKAGDKFASRYSQKGTISVIVPQNTLPRIATGPNKGMYADFYVNPHAIPSRMPMGEITEMFTSKAALYIGKRINATTFSETFVDEAKNALQNAWEKNLEHLKETDIDQYHYEKEMGKFFKEGYEDMEIPIRVVPPGGKRNDGPAHMVPSGRFRKCRMPIFVGPCNMQTLRHHVQDKFQVRAGGTIDPKTHQPIGGRAREGGQRVGEMERDAIISHGASATLLERLMKVSDEFEAIICAECGHFAVANMKEQVITCGACGTSTDAEDEEDRGDFGRITIPYVFKYMIHLLMLAHISITFKAIPASKFGTGKNIPEDRFVT